MFYILCALMCVLPRTISGHCYGIGKNPGFSDKPIVKQLSPWSVRVSWDEIVTQRECSDHFLVKYWKTNEPQNIIVSNVVDSHTNHLDLDVKPETDYTFKVVAREIKKLFGIQWDTDDNHSDPEIFRTAYEKGDCIWSTLGEWSKCSATCGAGNQTARRHILRKATHGGRPCTGPEVITRQCTNDQCNVLRPGDGHWGAWTDWNSCPSKSYARSFRLRFEPNQGPLFDDSGLNSIQIKCVDSDGAETSILKPHDGHAGGWTQFSETTCKNNFIDGVAIEIYPKDGTFTDSRGATNLRMVCADEKVMEVSNNDKKGKWGETKYCSKNMAICGIKIRMADSDTALNGAMFKCCDLPNDNGNLYEPSTYPHTIITTEIQNEQATVLPLDVSKTSENAIDVKQKHSGVQIYSLNRDSDDSGVSPKSSLTTLIAFTNKTIQSSTAAIVIEKETSTPAVLSEPWNNRKPLRYKGGSKTDANYTKNEDENDSTVFVGIGGFIVSSCLLMAIAILIYKRSRKPVSGSKELINEDSIIEGVEFHNIDGIRGEENIYEPAPGEVSSGRNQNKNSGKNSTTMENHM